MSTKPKNPWCPYYVMLGEAERRILSEALISAESVALAAEKLGISTSWFRTRCMALDIPVTLTASTRHLLQNRPDRRGPTTPKLRPKGKPRSEAQKSASLRNLERSSKFIKPKEPALEPVAPEPPATSLVTDGSPVEGDDTEVWSEDDA